jgi:AbrB family looped-hinge helix DNA binding protein
MAKSTITSKGQTTIPIEIRRRLKLKQGDRIEFFVQPDGKVVLIPRNLDIRALKGMLGPAPRRVSIEEMNAAIRKRAVQRALRK